MLDILLAFGSFVVPGIFLLVMIGAFRLPGGPKAD